MQVNNSWLQFLIPKIQIKVNNLSEVSRLRAEKVKIYRVKRVEKGYLITISRGNENRISDRTFDEEISVVGHQSIYTPLFKFALPVAFLWVMLLVAIQFVTIDYEVRGNLTHEDIHFVNNLIEPHFINMGPFAFFRGDNDALAQELASAFHDYIWIDIQTVGSRLFIDIFDTQITKTSEGHPLVDTLYARASGVVTDITVHGCRVLVEIDQVVYFGDALITCYTPTGFAEEIAPIEGYASGTVRADVWYEVNIEFPREYAVRMATGSSRSNLFLNFRTRNTQNQLRIWGKEVPYENFDTRNRLFNPLAIFNISPITLERVHYYEKSDIILKNEVENIRKRADILVENQLKELISGEFELIDLQFLSLEETEDMVQMIYHATINENIANHE